MVGEYAIASIRADISRQVRSDVFFSWKIRSHVFEKIVARIGTGEEMGLAG